MSYMSPSIINTAMTLMSSGSKASVRVFAICSAIAVLIANVVVGATVSRSLSLKPVSVRGAPT
jgi:hypothetical protein